MESGAKWTAEHPLAVFLYSRLEQVPGPMADAAQSLNQLKQDRSCTFISKIIPQVWFIMISS